MKLKFINREYGQLNEFCGLRIWEKPKFKGTYAIGVDIAEGVGKDASCAQVIHCETGAHVASFWSNRIDVDTYAAEVFKLGKYYNTADLCIELNNHGNALVALMGGAAGSLAYPNLYKRIVFDEYTQKRTKKVGFKTTSSTKPRIIENLKSALRDGETLTHDKSTILELSNFIRDIKTGRMGANGSARDDRVMAYALAWEQAKDLIENIKYTNNSKTGIREQEFDEMTGFLI